MKTRTGLKAGGNTANITLNLAQNTGDDSTVTAGGTPPAPPDMEA